MQKSLKIINFTFWGQEISRAHAKDNSIHQCWKSSDFKRIFCKFSWVATPIQATPQFFYLQNLHLVCCESFRSPVPAKNSLGGFMCPFQLDGVEWLHSTHCSNLGQYLFGGLSPQNHLNKICEKILPSPKLKLHQLINNKKLFKFSWLRSEHHPPVVCKDRPESISPVFEWLKLVKAFSSYVSTKKKKLVRGSMYGSETLKLMLSRVMSLTVSPWLCHRRVRRVSPDILPETLFFAAHRFRAADWNMRAAMAERQLHWRLCEKQLWL